MPVPTHSRPLQDGKYRFAKLDGSSTKANSCLSRRPPARRCPPTPRTKAPTARSKRPSPIPSTITARREKDWDCDCGCGLGACRTRTGTLNSALTSLGTSTNPRLPASPRRASSGSKSRNFPGALGWTHGCCALVLLAGRKRRIGLGLSRWLGLLAKELERDSECRILGAVFFALTQVGKRQTGLTVF